MNDHKEEGMDKDQSANDTTRQLHEVYTELPEIRPKDAGLGWELEDPVDRVSKAATGHQPNVNNIVNS
jgi:hypothetical protein